MGWDGFYAKDRDEAIKIALDGWDLIEDPWFATPETGSQRIEVWTLSRSAHDGLPWICCHLIDGPSRAHSGTVLYNWKPMGLEMGPFYYGCPLSWLERTKGLRLEGEAERKWRAERLKRAGACLDCGRAFSHSPDCPRQGTTESETLPKVSPAQIRYANEHGCDVVED